MMSERRAPTGIGNMKSINLGNNLYNLRKKRGLSQEEFAEKIHISRQAVSKWERGEAFPDTENLIEIAEFYGVTIDELVNRAEPFDGVAEATDTAADEASASDTAEDEDGKSKTAVKVTWSFNWHELPYPLIVTAAYLLLGFLVPDGWAIYWTLFITIPIYYTVVECIKAKRFSPFAYPVLCAFVYCLCGMLTGVWHPSWLIFISIPIYYWLAYQLDKAIATKRGEDITVEVDEDDEDEE